MNPLRVLCVLCFGSLVCAPIPMFLSGQMFSLPLEAK